MAKEIRGWRDERDWDYKGTDQLLKGIMVASQSDDGWYCPHCNHKETPEGCELREDEVINLWHNYEPIKTICYSCGNTYYVKCYTRFMYFTCEDNKFEE